MQDAVDFGRLTCARPHSEHSHILLGHGSGGRMTADLIQKTFLPAWNNAVVAALEDQATLDLTKWRDTDGRQASRLAFTTDSFVVHPLFFPGGDIGSLAIHGAVNDLAVGGAIPQYVSAAFILEEGLLIEDLRRVVASMSAACREAGVTLVTGDTKVVDRGKGDQLFITTSAIGWVPENRHLSVHNAKPGDRILVSGTIGDHGIAIMSQREGIEFETVLVSDSAPLNGLTEAIFQATLNVRAMRDPTRGGISSALHEIASASGVGVRLIEKSLPIRREVRGACEMLGLEPLYVANEGKLIAIVPPETAETVLTAMRKHPLGLNAAEIGEIVADHPGIVVMKSLIGGERVVTMLAGEQLPRIC